nr:hypothetical protein CFP56_57325 [Quercus suber]
MELIQNAEDNDYLEGKDPSLEFVITSEDITNTMATATLLIFNNEKGIGFKSVFLVSSQPYIFSNGYQIRFNEEPCPHCNLGYIVPEWVEENPTLSDIKKIYSSGTTLPTTTIVLPLKFDKIKPVKQQLLNFHPEVLLFLSKIRRLSVREHNNDPRLNTVSAIAITSETELVVRKNIDAVSYTIHLSADENGKESEGECRYFMWKQKFPVRQENKVERRMEIEELVITLAFPFEERLHRGMSSPGIYAFLPTEMFTNFPFIIQADFLLASSRETILLDNKWNQGILDCVPSAFINAFVSLVKNSENARVSSLASMFRFIPINSSSYQTLNVVRESIKSMLLEENILPSESYTQQKIFHKPHEVGRLMPAFWTILEKAREQKVSLVHLSSHGKHILSSSFDRVEYDNILNFLGVEQVNKNVHLNNYLDSCQKRAIAFVHFLYHSLEKSFLSDKEVRVLCESMPLVDNYGNLQRQRTGVLVPANGSKWVGLIGSNPWTNEGYIELAEDYLKPDYFAGEYASRERFLEFLKTNVAAPDIPDISPPNAAIPTVSSPLTKKNAFLLLGWIRKMKLREIYIPENFLKCIKEGSWLKITTIGCPGCRPPSESFMLSSSLGNILQNGSVLVDIPLIDLSFYGDEINEYEEELKKIDVMSEYGEPCEFIGKRLMSFTEYSTLSRQQVLSILNFIRFLREKFLPQDKFFNSIKGKRWLKTSCGVRSPVESVLFDEEWKTASQISSIPFIDRHYFGEEILSFREELKSLGVVIGFIDPYKIVVDNLKLPPSSSLTAEAVLLILECVRRLGSSNQLVQALSGVKCFMTNLGNELKQTGVKVDFEEAIKEFADRFKQEASSMTNELVLSFLSCHRQLKDNAYVFPPDLRKNIRDLKWLQTRRGDKRSPRDCILFGPDWQSILPITVDLPFLDDSDYYYGKEIHKYKEELKNMGVVVEFKDGAKPPEECLLFDPRWGSYLERTDGPFIDEDFYGSNITLYKEELKAIGVMLDVEEGCSLIASHLEFQVQLPTIVRIYNYLSLSNWENDIEVAKGIWIPDGSQNGEWVSPCECVLHDKDGLFSSQLKVLDKYYEQKFLDFFSHAFRVKCDPPVPDYCELWEVWESSGRQLSHDDCLKYWGYIWKHWGEMAEKTLTEKLVKLPVASGSDEVLLFNKHDVFIADDLQLKDLFEQFSAQSLFVWYPQPSNPSLPQMNLFDIYKKLGVRTISESVEKEEYRVDVAQLNQVIPKENLITKDLVTLILGFLANPVMKTKAERRHEIIRGLLNITFLEIVEPITVKYS